MLCLKCDTAFCLTWYIAICLKCFMFRILMGLCIKCYIALCLKCYVALCWKCYAALCFKSFIAVCLKSYQIVLKSLKSDSPNHMSLRVSLYLYLTASSSSQCLTIGALGIVLREKFTCNIYNQFVNGPWILGYDNLLSLLDIFCSFIS